MSYEKRFLRFALILTLAVLLAAAVWSALSISGCASVAGPDRQSAALEAAYSSYANVGARLLEARQAGLIADDAWLHVQQADRAAWASLEAWHAAVVDGLPPEQAAARARAALLQLATELLNLTPAPPAEVPHG